MAYIEHDFPIEGLNKTAQKEGNANGWLPECHPPGEALDLLEEACARARIPISLRPADQSASLVVTAPIIAEVCRKPSRTVLTRWVVMLAEGLLD